jgi:hypothetical protein
MRERLRGRTEEYNFFRAIVSRLQFFECLKNWTNASISVYGSLSVGSGVQGQTYTVSNTVGTTGNYILIQFSSGNSKNIYITK